MSEETIFLEVLQKPTPAERGAFLDEACAGDAELRRGVERLLRAHQRAGQFLQGLPDVTSTTPPTAWESPGTVIGPYRLLEPIGEGGFGIVFLAEQQQPIRRKVALKLLKPGMDSKQVVARFEAERQALALMDHPNIAAVHDAGETASGRPYFVMELVRGMPVTDYCDQNGLTPRERLGLFVSVCQAVQHAHHKGIIHRDLKPSNVLVAQHDGAAVVKVIDFGIAKALGQELTDKTLCTGFAQMIGTPLYMSPEQAQIGGLDIDTRSDIYSLGVLLYELLTGTTPFDRERLGQVEYDELRRIIREEEPPRPSRRISTLGQAALTMSARRKSDPRRLSQLLRGELDWIVMKCLEKDRGRRYDTANALALDIERYLHDEPVQACPPSAWYRFRKFTRRNRTRLGMATALGLAVLAAAGIVVWRERDRTLAEMTQARNEQQRITAAFQRETELRHDAEKNLDHSRKNVALALLALDKIYLKIVEADLPSDPHSEQEHRQRLRDVLSFYEAFARHNSAETMAQGAMAIAHGRAGIIRLELGQIKEAERSLGRAVRLLNDLRKEFPRMPARLVTGTLKSLAFFQQKWGRALQEAGRLAEAEKAIREALKLQTELAVRSPDDDGKQLTLARIYDSLGAVLFEARRYQESVEARRQALGRFERLVARDPKNAQYRDQMASTLAALGAPLRKMERLDEAEKVVRRALECQHQLPPEQQRRPGHRGQRAANHYSLGQLLWLTGRFEGAEQAFRQAVALWNRLAAEFPALPLYQKSLASGQNALADLLWQRNRPLEAEKAFREALDLRRQLLERLRDSPDSKQQLADTLSKLGRLLTEPVRAGRPLGDAGRQEAEQLYRQALELWKELAALHPDQTEHKADLAGGYADLSELLWSSRRHAEAERANRQALEIWKELAARFPGTSRYEENVHRSLCNSGNFLLATGRLAEAEKVYREFLGPYEKRAPGLPLARPSYRNQVGGAYCNLAVVHLKADRLPEAETALSQARALVEPLLDQFPKVVEYQRTLLGVANNYAVLSGRLASQGKAQEAERASRQSRELRQKLGKQDRTSPAVKKPAA
jgi:serine/threonine protein kinase/tetratricopeptide (TPR) repeat protein